MGGIDLFSHSTFKMFIPELKLLNKITLTWAIRELFERSCVQLTWSQVAEVIHDLADP